MNIDQHISETEQRELSILVDADIYEVARRFDLHFNTLKNVRDKRSKVTDKTIKPMQELHRVALKKGKREIKRLLAIYA